MTCSSPIIIEDDDKDPKNSDIAIMVKCYSQSGEEVQFLAFIFKK